MPAQHPDMTESPRRRSEDDLRTALASLEQLAPNRERALESMRRPQPRALARRRSVAVASCLLACAAAVVVLSSRDAASPGRTASHPSLQRAILTAFDSASTMVLESRATVTANGAVTGRSVSWSGPTLPRPGATARYRYVLMTAAGHPVSELAERYTASRRKFRGLAHGFVGSGGVTRRITTVDYRARTWRSVRTRQDAIVALADNPALLRHEVALGYWRVARRTDLDGRPALELVWKPSQAADAWPAGGAGTRPGELHRTLWVDAHSYLPLRQRIQLTGGAVGPFYGVTADYRLLPPTPANLAKLRPVVPKGFSRTHGPHGAVPLPVSPFL
jgi:hypothetical protein